MSDSTDVWVLIKSNRQRDEELLDIYWLESDAITDLRQTASDHQRALGGELVWTDSRECRLHSNERTIARFWIEPRRIKGALLAALAGQAV